MADVTRVLIVEDQSSMQQLLEDFLSPHGFEVSACHSAAEACQELGLEIAKPHDFGFESDDGKTTNERLTDGGQRFDVVLTDVKMPGMSGLEFCRLVKQHFSNLPVIVMTAYGSLETAVEALRAGAFDFVTKPVELELLKASLARAAENSQLRRRVDLLESQSPGGEFPELIGQSDVMLQLRDQLSRVVDSSVAVLLTGESGSGKEVVARALHQQSERADRPFVAVNCAALPEALLESELFGHVKGAFTDAKQDRLGLFLEANGGTLFLDEIGEMPIEIQPKLLRALEQKTVRPVGGKSEQPFDVHLITATNRDLEAAIEEKKFREDLYYRINVMEIAAPPLRSRGNDVVLLANHFLKQFAAAANKQITGLNDDVLQKFLGYDWPGNVRELRNVIERAVVMARHDKITAEVLPTKIADHSPAQLVIDEADNQPLASLETIEQRYIRFVLERTDGNKTEAAKVLGLDRKTLYRKLKESGA
ncbi:MAG: two-component system response regulator HydG [Mariniblastus sp.]|jgi:two-component system response regulator HydG